MVPEMQGPLNIISELFLKIIFGHCNDRHMNIW